MHHKAQQEHLIYNSQGFALVKRVQRSKQSAATWPQHPLPLPVVTTQPPGQGEHPWGAPSQGCWGSTTLQLAVQEGKEANFLLPALSRFVHPMPQFPPGKVPQLRAPHENQEESSDTPWDVEHGDHHHMSPLFTPFCPICGGSLKPAPFPLIPAKQQLFLLKDHWKEKLKPKDANRTVNSW